MVQINTKALFSDKLEPSKHYVFNVACGQTTDLNTLWSLIKEATATEVHPVHGPNRPGDIFFSLADVASAINTLGYIPNSDLKNAIKEAVRDYRLRYFH